MEKEEFLATIKEEKSVEEILALATENGVELTDDELKAITGGTLNVLGSCESSQNQKSSAGTVSEKDKIQLPIFVIGDYV